MLVKARSESKSREILDGAVLVKGRSRSTSRANTGWWCTSQSQVWKYKSGGAE